MWRKALANPRAALAAYQRALALGGVVGLKALFRAAGLDLDFRPTAMRPIVAAVMARVG